jgi:hypothetical protein
MNSSESLTWYLSLTEGSRWKRYCRDLTTGRLVVIGADDSPGEGWRRLGNLGRRTTWEMDPARQGSLK